MTLDVEYQYLSLLDEIAARSEYAVAERGYRNDLDTVGWTVTVFSAAISGLAGGVLGAWGEDLAEATGRLVQKISKRKRAEATSVQQVQDLETLHRIVVEVRGQRGLPKTIEHEIIQALTDSGLDDESARTACRRLMRIVGGKPDDD